MEITEEEFTCALSNDRHIVKEPIKLSNCNHVTCKMCLPVNRHKKVKCKFCDIEIERCLINDDVIESVTEMLKTRFKDLVVIFEKKIDNSLDQLQASIDNKTESINVQIQYIEEEIEIRIETIKDELDRVFGLFKFRLNKIKDDILETNINEFQMKHNQLKHDLNCSTIQNEKLEKLYEYQKTLNDINFKIENFKKLNVKLDYEVSDMVLNPNFIGKIDYTTNCVTHMFEKRFMELKYDVIEINYGIELDVLPNGNLVLADYSMGELALYDRNFSLIRTCDKINEKECDPYGVTNDGENKKYISDYASKSVIMTDLEFNYLDHVGDLGSDISKFNFPAGISYSNDRVYVCDCNNRRIQIFSSDLKFIGKIDQLDYRPWHVKVNGKVACVDSRDGNGVYFYDIDTFTLKSKFNHGECRVNMLESIFYEFSLNTNKLYCYNNDGKLLREFEYDKFLEYFHDPIDGSMVQFHDFIVISSYSQQKLIRIQIK